MSWRSAVYFVFALILTCSVGLSGFYFGLSSVPNTFISNPPSLAREALTEIDAGKHHYVTTDIEAQIGREPVVYNSFFEYRGYAFFDFRSVETGCYFLLVYHWNGEMCEFSDRYGYFC